MTTKNAPPSTTDRQPEVELEDLEIVEGSPVPGGDNPPAKIAHMKDRDAASAADHGGLWATFKRWAGIRETTATAKEYGEVPRTVGQIVAMDDFKDRMWKLRMALMDSMNSILACAEPEQMGPLMAQSVQDFTGLIQPMVANLSASKRRELTGVLDDVVASVKDRKDVKKVQLVDALQRLDAFDFDPRTDTVAIERSTEDDVSTANKNTISLESIKSKLSPEEQAWLKGEINGLQERAAKAPAEPPAPDPVAEAAKSGAAPEVIAMLKTMSEKLDAQGKEISNLRGDQDKAELTAKAKAYGPIVNLTHEDVEGMLRSARKEGPDAEAKLDASLKSLAAASKIAARFSRKVGASGANRAEKGTGSGNLVQKSAHSVLLERAEALRKSDPKLTKSQAYKRAGEADPDLKMAAIQGREVEVEADA